MALDVLGTSYTSTLNGQKRSADPGNVYIKDPKTGVINQRPISGISFSDLLQGTGLQDYGGTLDALRTNVNAATDPTAYQLPDFNSFQDQASSDVSSFYDKDLELLNKKIAIEKEQQQAKTDTGLARNTQDQGTYFKNADTTFARALDTAQSGFTGRGTADSGFRMKSIGQLAQNNQTNNDAALLGFTRTAQNINTDQANFTQTENLSQEQGTLDIQRQQEQARLQDQTNLYNDALLKLQAQQKAGNQFLTQALG